jgi:hypothetical protein
MDRSRPEVCGGEPKIIAALIRGAVPTRLDPAAIDSLERLIREISVGKDWLETCRAFKGHTEAGDWRDFRELTLHWRWVCALGIVVAVWLKRSPAVAAAIGNTDRLDTLVALLREAGRAMREPGRGSPWSDQHRFETLSA